jgi:hypothetical protein
MDRSGTSQFQVKRTLSVDDNPGTLTGAPLGGQSINVPGTNVERGGLTWAVKEGSSLAAYNGDSLLVATGESGLYTG